MGKAAPGWSILDAINDPNVFGSAFRDRRSWESWFSFLAALFGLPLTEAQAQTFTQATGRAQPPSTPSSESWLVVGRRGGKSFILALTAVFLAAFKDWKPFLGPGERATIMIIAADRKQARTILRYVRGLLHLVPMLSQLIENERAEAIDLDNRVTIEVHTASFRTVRGYTVVACLCDEIAFWPTEDSASPDTEVINAIRPAMATVPGALLLCASSPYSRKGALYDAYKRYFGHEGPVLVWQADSRTMNPSVPQSFIDAEMEKDPVSAEAEYGAQFRNDIDTFISREAVEAVVNHGVLEYPPLQGRRFVAFVDPSGGSNDSFTLGIAHKNEDGIAVLDVLRERRPPFSPEGVVSEFAELLKQYRITKVQGDRYAGEWPREQFRKLGISYDPSASPKSDLYREMLPLLNSGKVRLLNNKRMIAQLIGLERRTSRAGRDSIDHAQGGHDDLANAAAGALVTATKRKPQMRMGTIDFVGTGRVTWRDEESHRQLIQFVTVTEEEDLRQRGLL